ncbi:MAG: LysR family transcriptional regulator, partial [Chitinophagaceae bacterium]|nr:LysR family transcriptional regulator [Rubrivivax sp.]
TLEVHASQQLMDLQRVGFHAAVRSGAGPWRGLLAEPLIDSTLIVVAAPQRAARLAGATAQQLAAEP